MYDSSPRMDDGANGKKAVFGLSKKKALFTMTRGMYLLKRQATHAYC